MLDRIAPIVFDTLLFALTLVKFVESVREGLGKQPVFHVIVRDATWAYALVCGTQHQFLGYTSYSRHILTDRMIIVIMVLNAIAFLVFPAAITSIFYPYVHTWLSSNSALTTGFNHSSWAFSILSFSVSII